ncbi:hypothetical protein DMC30DRAFT_446281, partial [Rhodotorula diobovata]
CPPTSARPLLLLVAPSRASAYASHRAPPHSPSSSPRSSSSSRSSSPCASPSRPSTPPPPPPPPPPTPSSAPAPPCAPSSATRPSSSTAPPRAPSYRARGSTTEREGPGRGSREGTPRTEGVWLCVPVIVVQSRISLSSRDVKGTSADEGKQGRVGRQGERERQSVGKKRGREEVRVGRVQLEAAQVKRERNCTQERVEERRKEKRRRERLDGARRAHVHIKLRRRLLSSARLASSRLVITAPHVARRRDRDTQRERERERGREERKKGAHAVKARPSCPARTGRDKSSRQRCVVSSSFQSPPTRRERERGEAHLKREDSLREESPYPPSFASQGEARRERG